MNLTLMLSASSSSFCFAGSYLTLSVSFYHQKKLVSFRTAPARLLQLSACHHSLWKNFRGIRMILFIMSSVCYTPPPQVPLPASLSLHWLQHHHNVLLLSAWPCSGIAFRAADALPPKSVCVLFILPSFLCQTSDKRNLANAFFSLGPPFEIL